MISVLITTDDESYARAGEHSNTSHLRIHDDFTGQDGFANYVWTYEEPGRDGKRGHYTGFPKEQGVAELVKRVLGEMLKEKS